MKAYSLDLRQRVLAAALRGDRTIPQVAELFGVSTAFVNPQDGRTCHQLTRRKTDDIFKPDAQGPVADRSGEACGKGAHLPRA